MFPLLYFGDKHVLEMSLAETKSVQVLTIRNITRPTMQKLLEYYSLTNLFTYLLRGAESFLRS